MQLTELASGETVTVGYGYRTDQYLLHCHVPYPFHSFGYGYRTDQYLPH